MIERKGFGPRNGREKHEESGKMWNKLLYGYAIVAIILFVYLVCQGKICKKDLGNGVKLGFLNSFILAFLWPISAATIFLGVCYEVVHTWKRL